MDLEGIMQSEINQSEKDKYCKMLLSWKSYQEEISTSLEDSEDRQLPYFIISHCFKLCYQHKPKTHVYDLVKFFGCNVSLSLPPTHPTLPYIYTIHVHHNFFEFYSTTNLATLTQDIFAIPLHVQSKQILECLELKITIEGRREKGKTLFILYVFFLYFFWSIIRQTEWNIAITWIIESCNTIYVL